MQFFINAIFIIIIAALFISAIVFYIKNIKKGNHCGGCSGCINCDNCSKKNGCPSKKKQYHNLNNSKK